MAKKSNRDAVSEQPVVDPRVLAAARDESFEPKPVKTYKCQICDEPGASDLTEGLCWVCRRLKISAWRDVEQQMPMGE